ncbi:MAG TPA: hypothetical protein DD990_37000, partial [Cyanobacteria bacterium UBA11368]|nr:hypothetical protein [Cyanobacteria bacterium UBA11368]
MATNTENQPNSQLTLYDPSNSPLVVREANLILTKQESEFVEARLTFCVELELYLRIDTQALFNLKPDVRTSLTGDEFQPNFDIQISASLKPDLLPLLLEITNVENLTSTSQQQLSVPLESISQTKTESSESPIHPLLATESWLGLSVQQIQASKTTGYRTLWSYINPIALSATNPNGEEIAQGIANFFQDMVGENLDGIAEDFSTQTIEALSNLFQELYVEPSQEASQESTAESSIFDTMLEFFTQDDWSFVKVEGEPALQLAIEGNNGRWNCYAEANESQQQMVFYSLCPINAPASKRQALAEFLTRINYGTIIGNFELDMEDGQIRYKTSIDVEGATLTFAQIKNLVYTNVRMMDEHLPGIMSVINRNLSSNEAITIQETLPSFDKNGQSADVKDSQEVAAPLPDNFEEKPLDTSQQEAATPSHQSSVQKQQQKPGIKTDVMSLLTPEETASFENAMQSALAGQIRTAKSLLAQIKSQFLAKKGNGEQIFAEANYLFQRSNLTPAVINELNGFDKALLTELQKHIPIFVDPNLPGKTVKIHYDVNEDMVSHIYLKVSARTVVQDIKSRLQTLKIMHHYWRLAERIRLLIEAVKQQGEPRVGSKAKAALVELQKLFSSIDARLQQFATGSLTPKLEIEALIEIGQLTEQLPVYEQ